MLYTLAVISLLALIFSAYGVIEWAWERREKHQGAAVGAGKQSHMGRTDVSAACCVKSSTGCGTQRELCQNLRKAG